jgi:hypothetical protein
MSLSSSSSSDTTDAIMKQIATKLVTQIVKLGSLNAQNWIAYTTTIMEFIDTDYNDLKGVDKKTLAVTVANQLVDATQLPVFERTSLQYMLDSSLPVLIDQLAAASKGLTRINASKSCFACWFRFFPKQKKQ